MNQVMENENGDAAEYRKQAPGSAVIRVSAENGDIKIRENVARSTLEETVAETKSVDEEEWFQFYKDVETAPAI